MLDVKSPYKVEEFEVVQGDSNSNIINISLKDGLEPFNLIGTNVEIAFKKSDGTTVLQSDIAVINAADGKISCTLKTNTIAAPGKVLAEVRVLEIDTLLTSTRFNFYVRPSIVNDETIESTNEFPVLTQLITTTEGLIAQVEQIEAQVPAQVVTDLNAVSLLANQLNLDLVEHKAELSSHKAENVNLKEVHGLRIETGGFTPILGASNVDGLHTYYLNYGRYTKINNVVYVQIFISTTNKDAALNGDIRIKGLPFASGANNHGGSFNIGQLTNVELPTNGRHLMFSVGPGASYLAARVFRDNAGQIMLADTAIKAGSGFAISGFYFID